MLSAFVLSQESLAAPDLFSRRSLATPPLSLRAVDGTTVTLVPFETPVTIIHFFATWCEPCRAELPSLRRLADRADPSSVRILAISVAEPDLRVRRFVQTTPLHVPVLLDRDGVVTKAWQVSKLPSTAILDRNLTLRLVVERELDWDQIEVNALVDSIKRAEESGSPEFKGEDLQWR